MKRANNKKKKVYENDPLDQLNLDADFVEAVLDTIWSSGCQGQADPLNIHSLSALCYEALFKIRSIKKIIDDIPGIKGLAFDTEGNIMPSAQVRSLADVGKRSQGR